MSVRIVAGQWRGRVIASSAESTTRPSTELWRSTIFNALQNHADLKDILVWDLFAGTGALGFEALSRGSMHCAFVEKNPKMCRQITTTATAFGAISRITVVPTTVQHFLTTDHHKEDKRPHLVLADPPYSLSICNSLLRHLWPVVSPATIVVVEHGDAEVLQVQEQWNTLWTKQKGGTVVDILERIA